MVPPCSHRVSRVRRYSGYSWLSRLFAYRIFTFFDWPSHTIQLSRFNALYCPNPEGISTLGLASSAFARHYWRNLCWFLFLALLRCFSSGGSPHMPMYSAYDDKTFLLPDCSIRKSTDIALTYSSPWLIAVSHVLHRLSVPRHSPCALCSLTINYLRYLWFFFLKKLSNFRYRNRHVLFFITLFRNCSIFTFY